MKPLLAATLSYSRRAVAFDSCVSQYTRLQPRSRAISTTAAMSARPDSLTAHLGGREEILEVAHIGRRRACVHEEVGDPDQAPVDPGSQRMHDAVVLKRRPGPVVAGRVQAHLIEVQVAAKQHLPLGTVLGCELGDTDVCHRPRLVNHVGGQ